MKEQERYYPKFVVWEITNKCNARCVHCGSESGQCRENELNEEEALALCDELKTLGTERVGIIGGEFFLSPYWEQVSRRLMGLGIQTSLLTNGLLLHDKNIAKLKEMGFRSISVSIDGIGETHDYLRGVPGLYSIAVDAIRKAKAEGFRIGINSAISKRNLQEVRQIFDLITELEVSSWQIQWVEDFGRANANPELFLDVVDMYEVTKLVAEFRKDTKIWISLGDNVGHFCSFEPMLRELPFTGCIAGRWNVGIEANGNVRACGSMRGDEHIEGNIRERSLTEIWNDPTCFRQFREKPLEKMEGFCAACEHARYCRAGCPSFAYSLTGSYYENPMCMHKYEVENGIA